MHYVLLDTNVYIDIWTGVLFPTDLDAIQKGLIVRHSAVVLSELRQGAKTRKAMGAVNALRKVSRNPWAPLAEDWWKAGELVQTIGDSQHWETTKKREFQNDALIALTARRHGSAIVTRNRVDFELLAVELKVRVMVV